MKVTIEERVLHFKQPAGTSRGVYTERRSWFVTVSDGERCGVGECAPLPDLSCDARPDYGKVLRGFCDRLEKTGEIPYEAMRDYPSNGLVWMGSYEEMLRRMEEKLEQGYHCVKLKIGAIDFEHELDLVRRIRERFSHREVELRLDANGGFPYDEALYKLELLSQYAIHSVEQPIRQGQWARMAELCRDAPLPIALDEELIGVNDPGQKRQLLRIVKPAYIVLKPSLHGGISGCREWIALAREEGVGSWITSALESNVGLNAIAQFCADVYGPDIRMPQGLGTGRLFTDNIPMSLEIRGERLWISRNS